MFSSMAGTLTAAIALSVLLMLAAALAEGRGRHIARLVFGMRSRDTLDDVLVEVPRSEGDWELLAEVNSQPDRPAPGARAAEWATDAASKARHVVAERASALSKPDEAAEATRTGELGLAHR